MALSAGSRLGPYEILAPIGAGGMGEVYRARDERLKRDVAVKVLPASYSQDADRLRRFEQEAQAAGALNHPNITAVYDLGSHDGAPYIVTELLEGETLRARMSGGAIAVRKATDYSIQIAKGLAAAHEKGIVHRDLKPENLFLTNDGRVKILDFGLAKLTQNENEGAQQTNLPTAPAATEPGVVMGTLGYMSPEQVKGKPADQRSDIFAFGAILYEMLSGARAFHRDSAAETMSAILREEPPDLSATNKSVQPGLERIVRHCLEKNPEERFYSTRDVAFDLEALSGLSSSGAVAATAGPSVMRRGVPAIAAVLGLVVAAVAGYWFHSRKGPAAPPSFHQLTFRRGEISSGRFGSDGKSVIYSAAWDGGATEIFLGRSDGPDARPFGLKNADVLAVSPSGEVAVSLNARASGAFTRAGTLARVAATGGGAPREIVENVEYADFPPDGKDIAIVRVVSAKCRLEYPIGKVIYETRGWIGDPRFSARATGSRSSTTRPPTTTAAPWRSWTWRARRRRSRRSTRARWGLRGRPTVRKSGSRRPTWAATALCRRRRPPVACGSCSAAPARSRSPTCPATDGFCWTIPSTGSGSSRSRPATRPNGICPGSTGASWPTCRRTAARCCSARVARAAARATQPSSARPTVRPPFAWAKGAPLPSLPTASGRSASCIRRPTSRSPSIRLDRERRRCCRFQTFTPGGRSGSRTGVTSSWRRSRPVTGAVSISWTARAGIRGR